LKAEIAAEAGFSVDGWSRISSFSVDNWPDTRERDCRAAANRRFESKTIEISKPIGPNPAANNRQSPHSVQLLSELMNIASAGSRN
jgi:hypothetical protein